MSALYTTAERAADWMSRGDDFEEAKAVRDLIAEHQALTAEVSRLSVCGKACEGFSTEALENILLMGDTLASRFKLRDQDERELTKQRDDLLAAAVKLVEDIELTDRAGSLAGYPSGSDEMIAMKEAIAKVKGGQS